MKAALSMYIVSGLKVSSPNLVVIRFVAQLTLI
jgi:hypothetical protein